MPCVRDFIVIEDGQSVRVYGVGDIPAGTLVVGCHGARRLRIEGPALVKPPANELTEAQWHEWLARLDAAGYLAELEPFWSEPIASAESPARTVAEVFDELLRHAH